MNVFLLCQCCNWMFDTRSSGVSYHQWRYGVDNELLILFVLAFITTSSQCESDYLSLNGYLH